HGLTNDAAGGREGEIGDLSPELGDGALALRLDLAGRAFAQPGDLVAGCRHLLLTRLGGGLLGAVEDLVGLAAGLLQGCLSLLFGRFAVSPGLLRVLQPLLDPGAAVVERLDQTAERDALD